MKFRQRVAWLLIFLYLVATVAACYYLFEVSERFGRYAVDHVRRSHPADVRVDPDALPLDPRADDEDDRDGDHAGFWHHVADLPLPLLGLVGFLIYLQVLCLLCACTRPTFTCHPLLLVVPIAGCIYLHRAVIPSTAASHQIRQSRSSELMVAANQKMVSNSDAASDWLLATDVAGPSWKVLVPNPAREPVTANADEGLCFLVT